MKNLYTFILLASSFGAIHAQDFGYEPAQELYTDLETDSYNFAHIDIVPPGGIQFGWETVENTLPDGWTYSLCDYTDCYTNIPDDGMMTVISPSEASSGVKGFLKITVDPGLVEGTATVKFYVYNSADYDEGDTITFTFNHSSSLSVDGLTAKTLTVYPNPASDYLYIENQTVDHFDFQLMNLVGEVVYEGAVQSAHQMKVDVSAFESGIYFLGYISKDGIRHTQKVLIK